MKIIALIKLILIIGNFFKYTVKLIKFNFFIIAQYWDKIYTHNK